MAERHDIEWKAKWKDDYLAWICGFANSQGGKLVIGKSNAGKVIGLSHSGKLMEDLPNKIRDAMGIIVDIVLKEEDGNEYIEINIPSYPITVACKGVFYYRSGSTNQVLTGSELERFILRRRGKTWDAAPVPYVSVEDLKESAFKLFRENAAEKNRLDKSILNEDNHIIIDKLHLKEGNFLTTAALLLFHDEPEKWVTGAYVKVGYFETDAELIYQDEIHGPLLEQAEKVVDLVYYKYLKAKISYDGLIRKERYPYPEEAMREAILNAIVHKDYSTGNPIQISVYDDKLYIANDGRLPETWTLEDLFQKHPSKPHNPSIAYVFYLAGFIETWGRGIEKICEACRKDRVPLPEYSMHISDIMVKFTVPEDRIIKRGIDRKGDRKGEVASKETTVKIAVQKPLKVAIVVL
jgi:ATP-dependent DNA helicase RecG